MEGDGNGLPEDDGSQNVISTALAGRLWDRFREGASVTCPRDTGPLAVAVDGAAKSYRLVCTSCGMSSPWFGSTVTGIAVRGPTPTIIPADAHEND